MSRTAAILERNFPVAAEPSPAPPHAVAPRRRPYAELAARLFPRSDARGIVAFGSVRKGEGVSTVARGLAAELAAEHNAAQVLAARFLLPDAAQAEQILGAPSTFGTSEEDPLAAARAASARILVDCGSLDESTDLLRLAPKLDGVVLVVEAGGTEKEQVERAAQHIREAGGKLLGVVLNKRRYPVPNWIYRHL